MTWRRRSILRVHIRNRAGSWLALVGQVCALVGLPIPAVVAKDPSKPFPCQHRVCGCVTADDCWKSCCCFSAGARVAWAQEHGVVPPDCLVNEASCESSTTPKEKSCCSSEKPTVVSKKSPSGAAAPIRWTHSIQAKQCQGGVGEEGGPSTSCPPAPPARWRYEWAVDSSLPILSVTPHNCTSLPLVPPPR